jgi:hypothetical protein
MTDERRDDDDDLGLDESLSSMRSMWREMKDEEPSDKGMAALLAAAREKADEMKPKRSWLAALLDQLRRPPVLAMATVVVLIGGAVVISQRKDELKTDSEMATASTGDNAAPAPPSVHDDLAGGAADDGDASERGRFEAPGAPVEPAAPLAEPPPPEVAKQHVAQRPTKPKPKLDEKKSTVATTPTEESKPEANVVKPADKTEPKAPASGALQIASGDEDDMQAKGAAEVTVDATQPEHKPVLRKPLPSIEGEDRAAKDSSVAQLIKQCEAAAAKNDCGAVRTIAAKIAQQDPQTYRSRVVKNPKVAKCLEPSPPAEAMPAAE